MNKMMIASIATVLATSSIAFAHGKGMGLARFDRDGNGVVTRDEMRTTSGEQFAKLDANKDGRLTLDEMRAAHLSRAAEHFAKKDKNNDGQLSRDEVPRMPENVFKQIDKNGDGLLSRDELAAAKGAHSGERGAAHFAKADADHDGAISQSEFIAGADRRFARIDTNGDGVITQDEMKAAHHHGKHGQGGAPGQGTPSAQ